MAFIELRCGGCGITFDRSLNKVNEAVKMGFSKSYCSTACMFESKRRKPRVCLHCETVYQPVDPDQKFCSQSCAAKYNNFGKNRYITRSTVYPPCLRCATPTRNKRGYCTKACGAQHQIELWLGGEVVPTSEWCAVPTFIRRYLMEECGAKCTKCSWSEVHPLTGKVPLQINHIDGNCGNNKRSNLEVLCPNCHSLTENFGALNVESANKAKKQRRRIE